MSNNFWRSMFFGALLACFVGGGLLMMLCRQMSDQSYQRGLEDCDKHNYNQAWEDGHLAGWRSAFAISRMSYDDSLAALRDSLEECRKERGK